MNRKRRDVEAGLLAKGYRQAEGDHHYFVYWTIDNKKSLCKTKTSHGSGAKDLDSHLLSLMAKQCALSRDQFLQLVDCPLSREKYEEIIQEKGRI